jgi:hypothetical protein
VHHVARFQEARVSAQKLGREVIRALDHHVDRARQIPRIVGQEAGAHELDAAGERTRAIQRALRGIELVTAHVRLAEQDLAMQIGAVDQVIVAQHDAAHAGLDQGERDRAAEAADADDERRPVLERVALRT